LLRLEAAQTLDTGVKKKLERKPAAFGPSYKNKRTEERLISGERLGFSRKCRQGDKRIYVQDRQRKKEKDRQ